MLLTVATVPISSNAVFRIDDPPGTPGFNSHNAFQSITAGLVVGRAVIARNR